MDDATTQPIRCPACGTAVVLDEAREMGRRDPAAALTCPTCGAGLDEQGRLEHEPLLGP